MGSENSLSPKSWRITLILASYSVDDSKGEISKEDVIIRDVLKKGICTERIKLKYNSLKYKPLLFNKENHSEIDNYYFKFTL